MLGVYGDISTKRIYEPYKEKTSSYDNAYNYKLKYFGTAEPPGNKHIVLLWEISMDRLKVIYYNGFIVLKVGDTTSHCLFESYIFSYTLKYVEGNKHTILW